MTDVDAPFLTWLLDSKMFRTAVAAEAAALGIPDMGGSVGPRAMRAVMMHGYKFSSGLRSDESISLGSRFHGRAHLAASDLGGILEDYQNYGLTLQMFTVSGVRVLCNLLLGVGK